MRDISLVDRLKEAQLWAAENKCYIEQEGKVGFGRECVGVLHGNSYVDTPGSDYNDFEGHSEEYLDRVRPPEHVTNYHKHDCLAVLGRGEESMTQLLDWIDKLRSHGAVVRIETLRYEPWERSPINVLLHGLTRPVIAFPDLDK